MSHKIIFGTDGWRGVIGQDFTFDQLLIVSFAAARYFSKHKKIQNGIVIGYDSRFLSQEFAHHVAIIIASAGIKVKLADKISTTPMVSLAVIKFKAAGGIVITASHNPAKYNGFKLKGDFGGPMHPEMISKLEKILDPLQNNFEMPISLKSFEELIEKNKIEFTDLTSLYIKEIESKIELDLIESVKLKILYDAMFGAGQGVPQLLVPSIKGIRNEYNPGFNRARPEPIANNLFDLSNGVVIGDFDLGIATDGDADRIGAVDETGQFVDSHRIFAIFLKYLVEHRLYKGEVAKSINISEIIPKMCTKYNLKLYETPVGFKHLCRLMTEKNLIIAGEESGGLGIQNHIPERDGIFNGLLLAEIMSVRRMKLSELVQELFDEFGEHHYHRIDVHMTNSEKEKLLNKFSSPIKKIGTFSVTRIDKSDGFKFYVDDGWVMIRASGTEPLVRFYAEADNPKKVRTLLAAVGANNK
ncbi:MAG: phosphoglucomutase/phosphomannomutase family protein [Bacteroidetes bacterium]|nr:phosphoglucomutase/phosphomannomutase family protein [Bacteroidota bacterium]